jgi:uncharacterized membrane protein YbaN (DUF454 family)
LSKALKVASGLSLVILGIIGLILPVMPGWVFLIAGLVILGQHFHWARKVLKWAKARFEDARRIAGGGTR